MVFLSGLTADNILIKTITDVTTSRRQRRRLQTSTACAVGYTISVANTAALGYSSAAAAYNATTQALTVAVSSGQFTTQLRTEATAMGASTLTTVTAANITVTAATIDTIATTDDTTTSNSDNKVKLNTGAIIGIVIGSVVAAVAILFFIYYFLRIRRAKVLYRPPRAARRPVSSSAAGGASQPQVDENGMVIHREGQDADEIDGAVMLGASNAAADLEEARGEERTTHIVLW